MNVLILQRLLPQPAASQLTQTEQNPKMEKLDTKSPKEDVSSFETLVRA